MWPLPIVSMLGVSGSAIFAYSTGVFMESMIHDFHWSRAQFSTIFALQMLLGVVFMPFVGSMIDRFGSRRVALFGSLPFVVGLSLPALANGDIWQWRLLCLGQALGQSLIAQTVWIAAITGRFRASRGMAIAVTLAGLGLGSMVWPVLAALYLNALGWRAMFPCLALTWAIVVVPLTWRFFHGAETKARAEQNRSDPKTYWRALRSRTFIGLIAAAGLFACSYFGTLVHLVPILRSSGVSLTSAAAIAGMAGLFSIIGRLATGYLLDHFPTRPIAIVSFIAPAIASLILWHAHGAVPASMVAVALLGLASGAELDLVTFIAARRFGAEVFGSIYGVFVALIAISASLGPVLAGAIFDATKSYAPFLFTVAPMALASAALIATIPLERGDDRVEGV
jgi:MFS family permease